ncbi:MAG: hypothetical protein RMJ17_02510 [Candidatus Aenigmarchaeota archaeon]|nr:hypothetical protein [Candidatus Aenigmarchaeota archaeon]MDW8149444.1 hypothetical protein [Candidatus Aenigmarchaeota archaeon]
MKIYVFGNPILEEDNLALRISQKLKKTFPDIEFLERDSIEDIEGDEIVLIDVAKGIKKVELIESLDKLEVKKLYSLHDYDIAYELKLLEKIGKVKKVKIIAIPFDMQEEVAISEVENYIHLIFKK